MQRNKRGSRQLWYAIALSAWIGLLSVVGFSMSREQLEVRNELVLLQVAVQDLESVLDVVREAARLGCSRPDDYRDQLEARGLRAVPSGQRGTRGTMEFIIPISTGETAWLSIACPPTGAWLARTGLSSGFEDIELRAYLHPLRRAR